MREILDGWAALLRALAAPAMAVSIRHHRPRPDPRGSQTLLDPDGVGHLSTPRLVEVWDTTASMLRETRTVGATALVVEMRRLYLDELTRRHPAEVQEWLRSGSALSGELPALAHRH
jgi:hypothetical protein